MYWRKFFYLLMGVALVLGGSGRMDAREKLIDSVFRQGVVEKLIPGGAVAYMKDAKPLWTAAYGIANVERGVEVTETTLFQIGSVTKIFTAIAVLQLVESGDLDLDRDVNDYLPDWQVPNPFSSPVTLRHLLTHTAGLNERVIGYQARSNDQVESLTVHLNRRMPGLFQAPGTEINYSNYGYALAGLLVELASEMPYKRYIREHILEPLGMENTTFHLPDTYREDPGYASGYKTRDRFEFIRNYPRNTSPAGGLLTCARDMGKFLEELITRRQLLGEESYRRLFSRQFTNHPDLTGYSLGFEEQRFHDQTFWVKGGQVQGFLSFLWVIPDQNTGLFYAVNTQTDNFSTRLHRTLRVSLFGEEEGTEWAEPWPFASMDEVEGTYRVNRHNRETIEDLFSLLTGNARVQATGGGGINFIIGGTRGRYRHIGDGVFQSEKGATIVFRPAADRWYLYRNYRVAGLSVPASYRKIPVIDSPSYLGSALLISLLICALYLVILPGWLVIRGIRRKKPGVRRGRPILFHHHLPLLGILLVMTLDILVFFLPVIRNPNGLLLGISRSQELLKYAHLVLLPLCLWLFHTVITLWTKSEGTLPLRIYCTLTLAAGAYYLYFLLRWHFFWMRI